MRKLTIALLICCCVGIGFGLTACSTSSKSASRYATFSEPGDYWVELVKGKEFDYWQISEDHAQKAAYLEPALGGTGQLVIKEGQLCFKRKHEQIPAVLASTYKVSEYRIQIGKDRFIKVGQEFKYDNSHDKGIINLIGISDYEYKLPKEFISSPCFQGEKNLSSIIIFYNPFIE